MQWKYVKKSLIVATTSLMFSSSAVVTYQEVIDAHVLAMSNLKMLEQVVASSFGSAQQKSRKPIEITKFKIDELSIAYTYEMRARFMCFKSKYDQLMYDLCYQSMLDEISQVFFNLFDYFNQQTNAYMQRSEVRQYSSQKIEADTKRLAEMTAQAMPDTV